jgi:hypothetical protein
MGLNPLPINQSIYPPLPAYENGTDRVFKMLAHSLQTAVNHPQESIKLLDI